MPVSEEEASDEDIVRSRVAEVDTQKWSHSDGLFPSVSERTISADAILDSHLVSIEETEEEGDDVFFSPSQKSYKGKNMIASSNQMLPQNAVAIHILPNAANIEDMSYSYCSDEEATLNDSVLSTDIVSELLESVHVTEEPCMKATSTFHSQCSSDMPTLVDTKITSSTQLSVSVPVPPLLAVTVTSSTPAKQASRPGSCLSSIPSQTSMLPEGVFTGEARHKDGSLLSIIFQVSCTIYQLVRLISYFNVA